mgnify:CR=1 FL=1
MSKCEKDDLFTPNFRSSSIGTLFGDKIFIIRCINTSVAIAIAIELYGSKFLLALNRVATYDVECHYGMTRVVSHFNHTFQNAVKASVNSYILRKICNNLNYNMNIRSRDNVGGAILSDEILNSKCPDVDFQFISGTIFLLFKSVKLSEKQINYFELIINNFTRYLNVTKYPIFKINSSFCGMSPNYRYVTNAYVQSLIPIPSHGNISSPFDFF